MIIMQVYAFTYKIKHYEIFCFHPTICKKKICLNKKLRMFTLWVLKNV